MSAQDSTYVEPPVVYGYSHHPKLGNTELWHRASETRYECIYLRLAVEADGNVFKLIEMDPDYRILKESWNYSVISQEIIRLTLRRTPYLGE